MTKEKGIKAKERWRGAALDSRVLVFIKRESFSHSFARVHKAE